MKERINELKTKMLRFFQQLMQRIAKWKKRLAEKLANKKTGKKGTSSDKVGRAGSNFAIIKNMDFLLELFSGRMFLAVIKSRGYNYV